MTTNDDDDDDTDLEARLARAERNAANLAEAASKSYDAMHKKARLIARMADALTEAIRRGNAGELAGTTASRAAYLGDIKRFG